MSDEGCGHEVYDDGTCAVCVAALRSDLAKAREEVERLTKDREWTWQVEAKRMTTRALAAERARDEAVAEVARLKGQKDGAYSERDSVVAALAWACRRFGWMVGLGRHVGENWDDDWRNIVFLDLPTGQASWHIHDSEMPMFDGLPKYDKPWDGHSTPEKYERLRRALGEARCPECGDDPHDLGDGWAGCACGAQWRWDGTGRAPRAEEG